MDLVPQEWRLHLYIYLYFIDYCENVEEIGMTGARMYRTGIWFELEVLSEDSVDCSLSLSTPKVLPNRK